MEIISSTQGFDKICLEGHMYVRKIAKNGWIRWECSMRRRDGCTGAMTTDDTAPVCTIVACNNHNN